jgi:hypothetical protein
LLAETPRKTTPNCPTITVDIRPQLCQHRRMVAQTRNPILPLPISVGYRRARKEQIPISISLALRASTASLMLVCFAAQADITFTDGTHSGWYEHGQYEWPNRSGGPVNDFECTVTTYDSRPIIGYDITGSPGNGGSVFPIPGGHLPAIALDVHVDFPALQPNGVFKLDVSLWVRPEDNGLIIKNPEWTFNGATVGPTGPTLAWDVKAPVPDLNSGNFIHTYVISNVTDTAVWVSGLRFLTSDQEYGNLDNVPFAGAPEADMLIQPGGSWSTDITTPEMNKYVYGSWDTLTDAGGAPGDIIGSMKTGHWPSEIPEPSTMALLILGIGLLRAGYKHSLSRPGSSR